MTRLEKSYSIDENENDCVQMYRDWLQSYNTVTKFNKI